MSIKLKKPVFYKTFIQQGFFPESNKVTKYAESATYWIFKTGHEIYKIKKPFEKASSSHLDELFCKETIRVSNLHSPTLNARVLKVVADNSGYNLENIDSTTHPVYYCIVMKQLSEPYFVNQLIDKNKLTAAVIEKIVPFLVEFHKKSKRSTSEESGSVSFLTNKINDLFYQSKKFLNQTITQPICDRCFFPMEKYLQTQKKIFSKRIKKKLICEIHGNFIPPKIHVQGKLVQALAASQHPLKIKYGDIACDLADFVIDLKLEGHQDLAAAFVDQYIQESNDKDLKTILPFYLSLRCFSKGLENSILMSLTTGEKSDTYKKIALKSYEQSIVEIKGLTTISS